MDDAAVVEWIVVIEAVLASGDRVNSRSTERASVAHDALRVALERVDVAWTGASLLSATVERRS